MIGRRVDNAHRFGHGLPQLQSASSLGPVYRVPSNVITLRLALKISVRGTRFTRFPVFPLEILYLYETQQVFVHGFVFRTRIVKRRHLHRVSGGDGHKVVRIRRFGHRVHHQAVDRHGLSFPHPLVIDVREIHRAINARARGAFGRSLQLPPLLGIVVVVPHGDGGVVFDGGSGIPTSVIALDARQVGHVHRVPVHCAAPNLLFAQKSLIRTHYRYFFVKKADVKNIRRDVFLPHEHDSLLVILLIGVHVATFSRTFEAHEIATRRQAANLKIFNGRFSQVNSLEHVTQG
ncbi:hypothetical protein QKG26_gp069 [Chelonid alphaherpesvirus 5]|uniref:Uncharacterized protein n=1 Tax=Chelonid alphaherpesvirus 5 TaxID=702736 RepID=V5NWX8_9ALPH|nr:hypothetical protein QKG26_gp069 [Chelonid alphaherpesvirus 5]AHA93355.1 hypothetical protein [Chelonid alphaherpesvirus 5]